ncbi:MAG: [acyl-carrier-protein] S-malonyltransferase [Gammaproteobacteria bacterium]|nr:MAG: [acyl-carrier-protein] S-malonyltransferase [Gammaproteobacteria bacterium]
MMFPGQGSQSVGMLAGLAAAEPVVAATFAEASTVLGYDLWQLCQSGPEERLGGTEYTQPAMLAAGVATWRAWLHRGGATPAMMAGHSLGEYSALVCAGAIDFTAAVGLVRERGRLMQQAVPVGSGAMAAILGLDDGTVEAACAEVAGVEVVEAVNYNAPGQLVIAGHAPAVTRAMEACRARGAKRAVLLPVSAPCHSSLMQPAAAALGERLAALSIEPPQVRVRAFDASLYDSPESIRAGLYSQLFRPVRWSSIVTAMLGDGARVLMECGPGKVLAGLARRVPGGREATVLALEGIESLDAARVAAGSAP